MLEIVRDAECATGRSEVDAVTEAADAMRRGDALIHTPLVVVDVDDADDADIVVVDSSPIDRDGESCNTNLRDLLECLPRQRK